MRLHVKEPLETITEYYYCGIWGFLAQQIEWGGLSFSYLSGIASRYVFQALQGAQEYRNGRVFSSLVYSDI